MYGFSQRLPSQLSPNEINRAVERLRANNGGSFIDLTGNNPTSAISDYPYALIAQALGRISNLTYRPHPQGMPEARQAIAQYYMSLGTNVDVDDVVLTASTSEAYAHLFNLLCDPGDAVLSPSPSYPLFEHLAALSSIKIKPYRLLYDGSWHIDFDHLRSQVCPRTKAIVVVHPNNPTGHFLSRSEFRTISELSRELHIPLISDEVFFEYRLNGNKETPQSFAGDSVIPSFALNGLSKLAGMPQMKLAWIVIGGASQFKSDAMRRLEIIADTFLSVSTPVQAVLPDLMTIGDGIREKIKCEIETNRKFLLQALTNQAANALHFQGGWSAILRMPSTMGEETWVLKLLNASSLFVQPGYFYDIAGGPHVVVSLLTQPDVFARGIERLLALLYQ